MDQTRNQQKSTDERAPLEAHHDEQEDQVRENTCRHDPFTLLPGRPSKWIQRSPSGTAHQVPNPDDGSSFTAVTRIPAVPNPEVGSSSRAVTRIPAVTAEAPATEDAHEVDNSNVTATASATKDATLDSSNVRPGGCPPVGITAPATEGAAAQNSNVRTTIPAKEIPTADGSDVVTGLSSTPTRAGTEAPRVEGVVTGSLNVTTDQAPRTEDVAANKSKAVTASTTNAVPDNSSNVGTEVAKTEKAVSDSTNNEKPGRSLSRSSSKVNDESSLKAEEGNKVEEGNKDEKNTENRKVVCQNSIPENANGERSGDDDITSRLTKEVESKVARQYLDSESDRVGSTEEKEVKNKSKNSSTKSCFCFA